jgi:hypothetical protein
LNEVLTAESLSEFGLPYNTEVVKDILSGGNSIRLKLLDAIEVEVTRSSIPTIQEQTRENLQPLIRLFDEFVQKAKGAIGYELRNAMRVTDYLIATSLYLLKLCSTANRTGCLLEDN